MRQEGIRGTKQKGSRGAEQEGSRGTEQSTPDMGKEMEETAAKVIKTINT